MICMALAYLVQHGEKEPLPGDPGLTPAGRQQASRTGRWLHGCAVTTIDNLTVVMIASTAHVS
jgi:broad specificity phosphatase PhoE